LHVLLNLSIAPERIATAGGRARVGVGGVRRDTHVTDHMLVALCNLVAACPRAAAQ
jgi:hypothetical protein